MRFFRWIGRLVAGAMHLAAAAFIGVVTLFSASLDFSVGVVARLYERFDAGWASLAREAKERHAQERRQTPAPAALEPERKAA